MSGRTKHSVNEINKKDNTQKNFKLCELLTIILGLG